MFTGASVKYSLSFRACSLRPDLARIVAECYLEEKDWSRATERILATNALQTRSKGTAVRQEQEMRLRLSTLTDRQLEILAVSPSEDRAAMTWLAACKRIAFVRDFTVEVLREKTEVQDHWLSPHEYEEFIAAKSVGHPELSTMSETTANKVRQVTLRMATEAGILEGNNKQFQILRPVLSPEVNKAIKSDDKRWFAVFLMPQSEILTL